MSSHMPTPSAPSELLLESDSELHEYHRLAESHPACPPPGGAVISSQPLPPLHAKYSHPVIDDGKSGVEGYVREVSEKDAHPLAEPVPLAAAAAVESSAPEGYPNVASVPAVAASSSVSSLPLTSAHPASWSSTAIDYEKLAADTKVPYKGIDYKGQGSWPGAHLLIQNHIDSGVLQFFFQMKSKLWVNDAFEFQSVDSKEYIEQEWKRKREAKTTTDQQETSDTTDETDNSAVASSASHAQAASAAPSSSAASSSSSSSSAPRSKTDKQITREIAAVRYRKLHASEFHMKETALYSIDRFTPPSDSWFSGKPCEIHFKPTKRAPEGQPHIVASEQLLRSQERTFFQEDQVEDHSFVGEMKSSASSSSVSASSSSSSSSSSSHAKMKTVRAPLAIAKKHFGPWGHFDRRVNLKYGLVELQWTIARMKFKLFCTNMICRDIAKVDQPIVAQLYVPYPALNVRYAKVWIHPDYLNMQALILASIFEEFEFMTLVG